MDCVVRVRAKLNGQPVLLEEERVSVVLVRPDASREDAEITGVDGDAVRLHLGHELLTQTGIYRLEVWLNRGGRNQMIGDRPAAFQLVPLSTQACDVADVYELGEVDMDFINPFVGVVDNLDSASDADALSARQGGVLKRMIEKSALTPGDGLVMRNGALHVSIGVGLEVGSDYVSVKIDSSTGLGFNKGAVCLNVGSGLDFFSDSLENKTLLKLKVSTDYANALSFEPDGLALKVSSDFVLGDNNMLGVNLNTALGCSGVEGNGIGVLIGSGISLSGENHIFVNLGSGLYIDDGNLIQVNVQEMRELLMLTSEA